MFFLSYARSDEPRVRALVDDLRQLGDVWRDQQIAGGQSWWREILRQIRVCDILVFAVSEASLTSPACQAEFAYALATHRPILPVKVGKVASLPRQLGELQVVDYLAGNASGGVRLATAVRRFEGYRPPLPSPLPPEPPPPEPGPVRRSFPLRRGPALAVAGVLVATVAAGGVALAQAGSVPPSSGSSEVGSPTAAVRDYYGVVTSDAAAGWAHLSPHLQAQTGSFATYQSFWAQTSSARVVDAAATDADTVRATVDFVSSGHPIREVQELDLVRGPDGQWLIDAEKWVGP